MSKVNVGGWPLNPLEMKINSVCGRGLPLVALKDIKVK
jgi:hypothetical protein